MARVGRHGGRSTGAIAATIADLPSHEADGIADQHLFAAHARGARGLLAFTGRVGLPAAPAGLLWGPLVGVAEGPLLQSGLRGDCVEIPQSYNRR